MWCGGALCHLTRYFSQHAFPALSYNYFATCSGLALSSSVFFASLPLLLLPLFVSPIHPSIPPFHPFQSFPNTSFSTVPITEV